ncbi:MAG: class I SAM-dependent methyltransferase [Methanobacteriota archaeon]
MTDSDASLHEARGVQAYDGIATRYDRIVDENRINAYMRRRSLSRLLARFRPGMRLVEVGCGTGQEALVLAQHGIRVVATDPSQEMLKIARQKARELGVTDRVEFHPLRARELQELRDGPDAPFDGGYASFSLAYEPDLTPVAEGLGHVLRSDALFVASVPSRVCLVEWCLAMAAGRPSVAGRRLRDWHAHKVGDRSAPIRCYTPAAFARVLHPFFRLDRVEALPAIVPPPYANKIYSRFRGLADSLESIDPFLARRFPFRGIGDHFLAEARRTGHGAAPGR